MAIAENSGGGVGIEDEEDDHDQQSLNPGTLGAPITQLTNGHVHHSSGQALYSSDESDQDTEEEDDANDNRDVDGVEVGHQASALVSYLWPLCLCVAISSLPLCYCPDPKACCTLWHASASKHHWHWQRVQQWFLTVLGLRQAILFTAGK